MVKKSSGFTIVELAIVIVVIGILAAIVVVSFGNVQKNARDVSLESDLLSTGKVVSLWLLERGNSISSLRSLYATYGGGYSSWVVGVGADNALTTQLHWKDVPELPALNASPGSTLEIIARYSGAIDPVVIATTNDRMAKENIFCIAGASPGSSYDYRPMSAIHSQYNRMLYFDSVIGKVTTVEELTKLYNRGRPVACTGHVLRWIQANS